MAVDFLEKLPGVPVGIVVERIYRIVRWMWETSVPRLYCFVGVIGNVYPIESEASLRRFYILYAPNVCRAKQSVLRRRRELVTLHMANLIGNRFSILGLARGTLGIS